MGILSQFKHREEHRIGKFFDYVDRFASPEVDRIIVEHFNAFAANKFLGQVIVGNLKRKIANVCHIPQTPGMTNLEFTKEVMKLTDGAKRCLLVTILNDVCKLGVMQEAQAYEFLESELKRAPKVALPSTDNDTPNGALKNNDEKEKTQ
jgi:hypothetical protein